MARPSKISRLPRVVVAELNERLLDNEPGNQLADWLNSRPEVQAVLEKEFGGRPITESNLSDWRLGGHAEWRRHQERLEAATAMLRQAEELNAATPGDGAVTDRMASVAAATLAQLLGGAMALPADDPKRQDAALGVVRELIRLRRTDHELRRMAWKENACPIHHGIMVLGDTLDFLAEVSAHEEIRAILIEPDLPVYERGQRLKQALAKRYLKPQT